MKKTLQNNYFVLIYILVSALILFFLSGCIYERESIKTSVNAADNMSSNESDKKQASAMESDVIPISFNT